MLIIAVIFGAVTENKEILALSDRFARHTAVTVRNNRYQSLDFRRWSGWSATKTLVSSGTSSVTQELAPMLTLSPISIAPRTLLPAPMTTWSPMSGS